MTAITEMASVNPAAQGQPIIRLTNVTKRFGGLTAVSDVSMEIYPGEVVALAGDNGAGKSTLIKMISGVYKPDEGHIYLADREITMASPMEARSLGIETIYQDLALCENLDATVNIFLGREPMKRMFGVFKQVDRHHMLTESKTVLDRLDITIPNLRRPIRQMSGGQRQAVAIARAVYWNAKLVIMDEPTTSLTRREVDNLIRVVERLRQDNIAVLFVTHKLDECYRIGGHAVVFRDGQ